LVYFHLVLLRKIQAKAWVLYDQGVLTPLRLFLSIRQAGYGVALNSLVNRNPLFTRLRSPARAMSFVLSTSLTAVDLP